jgi:hypothetical protein
MNLAEMATPTLACIPFREFKVGPLLANRLLIWQFASFFWSR